MKRLEELRRAYESEGQEPGVCCFCGQGYDVLEGLEDVGFCHCCASEKLLQLLTAETASERTDLDAEIESLRKIVKAAERVIYCGCAPSDEDAADRYFDHKAEYEQARTAAEQIVRVDPPRPDKPE